MGTIDPCPKNIFCILLRMGSATQEEQPAYHNDPSHFDTLN
jgi:hypothetical protein